MRIAYIGLSTPLMYDYEYPASRTPSDLHSSPNPILDSPFGLMLLYDELWFLCRSLCPENMRALSYVRFMDEEGLLPDISDIDFMTLEKSFFDDAQREERYGQIRQLFINYELVKEALGISWDSRADHHTHMLKVGPNEVAGNSVDPRATLFDLLVATRLEMDNLEFVANSFGQYWLEDTNPAVAEASLTEILTIDNIPNYLTPMGPFHPVVEEARGNSYLEDFREWVISTAKDASLDEVQEVKSEVEAALQASLENQFLEYIDPAGIYNSVGKTILGVAADIVAPLSSTIATIVQDAKEEKRKKQLRWQGFLVSIRSEARKFNMNQSRT